jgi:hypothetical protein
MAGKEQKQAEVVRELALEKAEQAGIHPILFPYRRRCDASTRSGPSGQCQLLSPRPRETSRIHIATS